MTALSAWTEATMVASTALMVLVLVIRAPVRRGIGPRLGYLLWSMPALRMILPPLPANLLAMPLGDRAAAVMPVLFVGPRGAPELWRGIELQPISGAFWAIWLAGAVGCFAFYAARHFIYCRKLRAGSTDLDHVGTIRVITADVAGPLAFGVFRRFVAVPCAFRNDYNAGERDLVLAHECAHHARGDLIASWVSLVVLALHWWNPVAWAAIKAFREDQEFAADAHVLAAREPGAVVSYAHVLAKAAGIGALPACNLNARSILKGRLMMLGRDRRSRRRLVVGGAALILVSGTALAATATNSGAGSATGNQSVTIGVKPDGSGTYALIIGDTVVPPGTSLPGGMTLPADFIGPGGCDLKPTAKPFAMVVKGTGATQTYTVMCASAAAVTERSALAEGLASLKRMRVSVATQPATAFLTTAERAHALGAIDRSIREVEETIGATR